MNRIVLEHYPASKLPDDLRGDIDASALVTVEVEVEAEAKKRLTVEELTTLIDRAREGKTEVSWEEAVARVRELRDEWDDR